MPILYKNDCTLSNIYPGELINCLLYNNLNWVIAIRLIYMLSILSKFLLWEGGGAASPPTRNFTKRFQNQIRYEFRWAALNIK